MVTPWPFYTWGLDLVSQLIAHPTGTFGSSWPQSILLSEWRHHFTKPLEEPWQTLSRKHMIVGFGVPHRIISDNSMPFVNRDVRKMFEYPQGNG